MDVDAKTFEAFVAAAQSQLVPGAKVEANVHEEDERGVRRQLDAILTLSVGPYPMRILVEATTRKVVDLNDIDAFAKKAERLRCDKVIVVTSGSFTQGAIDAAPAERIELWRLRPIEPKDVEGNVRFITGTLTVRGTEVRDVQVETEGTSGRTGSLEFSAANAPAWTVHDESGAVVGNLWSFFLALSKTPGTHSFDVSHPRFLKPLCVPVRLKKFSFTIIEMESTTPWEIDLEKDLVAVYEGAAGEERRIFVQRVPGMPPPFPSTSS